MSCLNTYNLNSVVRNSRLALTYFDDTTTLKDLYPVVYLTIICIVIYKIKNLGVIMDNVHSLVREDWSIDQEFIHAPMKNKLIVVNVGWKDLILIG